MAIQLKRSLSANLNQNYVLAQGQIGIEMPNTVNSISQPFKMKIGDGSAAWKDLPYQGDTSNCIPTSRKINGKNLMSDVILTADDIGARSNTWNPSLTDCTGVLPIANGGTGKTDLVSFKRTLWRLAIPEEYNDQLTIFSNRGNEAATSKYESYITSNGMNLTAQVSNWSKDGWLTRNGFQLTFYAAPSNGCCLYGYGTLNGTHVDPDLGKASTKWGTVYAANGTIQTSDRSAKTNIQYLDDADVAIASDEASGNVGCTTADVLSFIQQFRPASFEYNHNEAECPSEKLQLGMIADDLAELPIYKYIATYHEWEAREAQLDADGNVIQEARPAGHTRGLQAIPLATCALTACKYLMQRVELLEEQLSK